jgi:hypothetical protein
MVILGTAPLYLENGASLNSQCLNLIKQAHPSLQVNILQTGANRVNLLQNQSRPKLTRKSSENNYIPGLYSLGFIFETEGLPQDYTCSNNEVFIGSSLSDAILHRSRIQLFLPRAIHFEQEGSFIIGQNLEFENVPIISPNGDRLTSIDIVS